MEEIRTSNYRPPERDLSFAEQADITQRQLDEFKKRFFEQQLENIYQIERFVKEHL